MNRPWLKFYDEGVPHTLDYPSITVPDFLRQSAQRFPSQIATIFLGARLTYSRLQAQVGRLAGQLYAMGVRKGDRVAIMLPNCPQTIIAYYATLSLGAVSVLTNPLYVERELEHQWGESGVETAFVLDLLWPRVEPLRRKLPLKRIIVTGIQDYLPFPKNVLFPLQARRQGNWSDVPSGEGVLHFKRLVGRDSPPAPRADVSLDDLACLQYTGGTTGLPKGAMLTHRNLVASVAQIRTFLLQGHAEAQDRRYQSMIVQAHLQIGLGILRDDPQAGKLRFQRFGALERCLLSLRFPRRAGSEGGLTKADPSACGSTCRSVAVGKVKQRSCPRVEPIACFELGARRSVVTGLHQFQAIVEQGLGGQPIQCAR